MHSGYLIGYGLPIGFILPDGYGYGNDFVPAHGYEYCSGYNFFIHRYGYGMELSDGYIPVAIASSAAAALPAPSTRSWAGCGSRVEWAVSAQ